MEMGLASPGVYFTYTVLLCTVTLKIQKHHQASSSMMECMLVLQYDIYCMNIIASSLT